MRVLAHIKKLDDAFGHFFVHVTCRTCKAWREIEPEALARLVGWSMTLEALAPRMRCSKSGAKAAEIVAVPIPRPREVPKNPRSLASHSIGPGTLHGEPWIATNV